MLMGISVAIALVAVLVAINRYSKKPELTEAEGFGKVLANKWYVDELYDTIIVKPIEWLGNFFKNIIEKLGIDGAVNGVGKLVHYSARQLRLVQNGLVGNYIMIMILAIVVFILCWFYDDSIIKLAGKIFN
jgi:NADH-quinone oxidoreductase subunit L